MLDPSLAGGEIVEAGRRMRERQLVVAREGNLSARVGDGLFLTTPAGTDKGRLRAEELVLVDGEGRALDGGHPSSELSMHLAIYAERPDVDAIVHGHPAHATAFAVAGRALDVCLLPEVVVDLGRIPLSDYGTPSTSELAASVRELVRTHHAILLRNHGAVAVGSNPDHALGRLETVEQLARITWIAEALGGAQALSEGQVASLMSIREGYGLAGDVAACRSAGPTTPADPGGGETERLAALVRVKKRSLLEGRG